MKQKLGEIAVEQGFIQQGELTSLLRQQKELREQQISYDESRLGQILLKEQKITDSQLNELLLIQKTQTEISENSNKETVDSSIDILKNLQNYEETQEIAKFTQNQTQVTENASPSNSIPSLSSQRLFKFNF